jgi:O-acetylhomoserine (thiol)-lyase
MKKIQSKLIHGGLENPNASYRSLKTPIYESVSFDFEDAKSMEDAFEGRGSGYFYTRVSNPTVTGLEDRLKLLAGADDCLCVSSGMAAITSAILTI